MKLTLRTCIAGLLVAIVGLFAAGPALAQDGPTMTAEPVAAAGENTVSVSGSGVPGGISLFIFPCPSVATAQEWIDASPDDKGAACDLGLLTPVTANDDGTFAAELTLDVPEAGLVIAMGDSDQTLSTATLITVGDAAPAEDAPAEEPAEDAEAAPAAESGDLAKTGVETPVMVGLGIALLGLGVGATSAGRRLGDR